MHNKLIVSFGSKCDRHSDTERYTHCELTVPLTSKKLVSPIMAIEVDEWDTSNCKLTVPTSEEAGVAKHVSRDEPVGHFHCELTVPASSKK